MKNFFKSLTFVFLSALTVVFLLIPVVASELAAAFDTDGCSSANVSEFGDYTLVYKLNIPANADYDDGAVPYAVDNTAAIVRQVDRVAYCMELDTGSGLQWVWVSMESFTRDPAEIGVPVISTGSVFQQTVSEMNVFSNVSSIITGTGITTGNIEFWHHCYSAGGFLGLPGASGALFDFDDTRSSNPACYGSMQIHNYGASQTLFAYNAWDSGGQDDVGIGNRPLNHPDWTFAENTGSYTARRDLYVLVTELPPDFDGDGDGIPDIDDNCPEVPNSDQADTDSDGSGDACDTNDGCTGTSVPEFNDYSLLYRLDVPLNADHDTGTVPYAVDNSGSVGPFDRVAYCLELGTGPVVDWVWVSMDAFTTVPEQTGVPVSSTGAVFQQTVSEMNVFSNVSSIITGTGITTGNVEFWHHCYSAGAFLGLPGASGALFDFDDTRSSNPACYGSMQIHNYGASQTLFAYNAWDSGGQDDVGIGNRPLNHPDWTLAENTGSYEQRDLRVFVRELSQDSDGDGVLDDEDVCPGGDDNADADGDLLPDFCDPCPNDPQNDADGDGICESDDNCDIDSNPDQVDLDGDGEGDACDPDIDDDGVANDVDNCVFDVNPTQEDADMDGAGDVCDEDIDGDRVIDSIDACVPTPVGEAVNADGCSISDICPCTHPGGDMWKNHGAYVSCVAHAANDFVAAGLITEEEKGTIVSAAGISSCGHKNREG